MLDLHDKLKLLSEYYSWYASTLVAFDGPGPNPLKAFTPDFWLECAYVVACELVYGPKEADKEGHWAKTRKQRLLMKFGQFMLEDDESNGPLPGQQGSGTAKVIRIITAKEDFSAKRKANTIYRVRATRLPEFPRERWQNKAFYDAWNYYHEDFERMPEVERRVQGEDNARQAVKKAKEMWGEFSQMLASFLGHHLLSIYLADPKLSTRMTDLRPQKSTITAKEAVYSKLQAGKTELFGNFWQAMNKGRTGHEVIGLLKELLEGYKGTPVAKMVEKTESLEVLRRVAFTWLKGHEKEVAQTLFV